MIKWIIIAIVACIVIAIVKVIFEWIKDRFLYIAAVGIPIVMIRLICPEIKLIFIIIGVVVVEIILFGIYKGILFIKEKLARRKEIKLVNKWLAQRPKMLLSNWVLDKLYDYAKTLYIDMSKNYHSTFMRYDGNTEIPIGRYCAFLSYFNRDPLVETPLAMFIKNSSSFNEIREYGCVFTEKGIYFLKEGEKNGVEKECILFENLYEIKVISNFIECKYIEDTQNRIITKIFRLETNNKSFATVSQICKFVIDSGISKSLGRHAIITNDEYEELIERACEDRMLLVEVENKFEITEYVEKMWALCNSVKFNRSELKKLMNGSQGHGYAAEYANNTLDRILGKNVINAAQQLDSSGRQIKDGADRIVNGVEYQSKYRKDALTTLGDIISDGQLRYRDSKGNAMIIEVPKGQKDIIEKRLEDKLRKGEISEIPTIVEGHLTYAQSHMVKQALTVQSLAVDTAAGVVQSVDYAVSMSMVNFAIAVWRGQTYKEAFQNSVYHSLKTVPYGVAYNVIITQLGRKEIANIFKPIHGLNGDVVGYEKLGNNIISEWADDIAVSIKKSSIAKSELGKAMGLDKVDSTEVIGGTITLLVTFGPDIWNCTRGKISKNQFKKNTAINIGGLVGSGTGVVLAEMLFPGSSLIGAIAGGGIGRSLVKNEMDKYIEDDAIAMFIIYKQEFIDVTMQGNLSKGELETVIRRTLNSDCLQETLQQMFMSGNPREYARECIMLAVIGVLSERKKISYGMYIRGMVSSFMPYVEALAKELELPKTVLDVTYIVDQFLSLEYKKIEEK